MNARTMISGVVRHPRIAAPLGVRGKAGLAPVLLAWAVAACAPQPEGTREEVGLGLVGGYGRGRHRGPGTRL